MNDRIIVLFLILFCIVVNSAAQEPPPRPISINVTAQGLSFGAFTLGATGGTVTVNPDGTRSSTGDVILLSLGYSYSPALIEVTGNPGTLVSILAGPDVSLPGSNGGSLLLHIGGTDPPSPFVINTVPPVSTPLYIGGTLTVGNPVSNPPGNYSGTFSITFVQE
ncbi:MAG TPA: DUF4402 domain-containing protein [Bacteroidales bacterium]|nr:DUF4402 domain-containing protein [Bacteroidales bacterium]HOM41354.1 DUF4402 domain-containing protein [Bacteroidales bacterium]HPP93115.1 DUF4402 domain-containing protein [Bacteroidales bacterium]